jgi:hypothetical protein
MKKQTAVEWLFAEYINPKNQTSMASLFLEALQMEKEQIIRARQDGLDNGFSNGSWDSNLYYNETYADK